jgi:hypothetical protein
MRPSLKERGRAAAWTLVPGRMSDRNRRYTARLRQRVGVTDLARRFIERHGVEVLGGPFAGMNHPLPGADMPIAKLLGCYEMEIHDSVDEAIRSKPPAFIDLGSADGYYAVGFAVRCPWTRVHAFDLSKSARESCRALAALNGVTDRISMHGRATAHALQSLPVDGSVVLCDVDGPEIHIFSDDVVRALHSTFVIIEMHPKTSPGVEETLVARFERSHSTEIVFPARRDPNAFPELQGFAEAERMLAVDELRWRTEGHWGIFAPRALVGA